MSEQKEMTGKWWKFSLVVLFMACVTYTFWFIVPSIGVSFENEVDVQITSRTEYIPGDQGQVITEVRYVLSGDAAAATCYASVYYPNKALLFGDQVMTGQSFGTHYFVFTVPSEEGVYEYQTRCDLGTRNVTRSKAFHVSSQFRLLNETIGEQIEFISEGTVNAMVGKTAASTWRIIAGDSVYVEDYQCSWFHINDLQRVEVTDVDYVLNVSGNMIDVLWNLTKGKFLPDENYHILCSGEDEYSINVTIEYNTTFYTGKAETQGLYENTYPSGFSISGNSCGGTFQTFKNGSGLGAKANKCNPTYSTYLNGPQNKFTWSEWLGDYAFSIVYSPLELVGNTDVGNPAKVPIYFQKTNNGSSARGLQIYINNADAKLTARVMGDSNQYLVYDTPMVINQTYDIVFVHKVDGTKSLYVDNVKVAENIGIMGGGISAGAIPAYTLIFAAADVWPVLIMGEGRMDNYHMFDGTYVLDDAGCELNETCGGDVQMLYEMTNDVRPHNITYTIYDERYPLDQYVYVTRAGRIRAVTVK